MPDFMLMCKERKKSAARPRYAAAMPHPDDNARIEILADADLAVPARILDLFTAQARMPQAFAFRGAATGLRLDIVTGPMPATRRAIILGKLRCITGVRSVREQPAALAVVVS